MRRWRCLRIDIDFLEEVEKFVTKEPQIDKLHFGREFYTHARPNGSAVTEKVAGRTPSVKDRII